VEGGRWESPGMWECEGVCGGGRASKAVLGRRQGHADRQMHERTRVRADRKILTLAR